MIQYPSAYAVTAIILFVWNVENITVPPPPSPYCYFAPQGNFAETCPSFKNSDAVLGHSRKVVRNINLDIVKLEARLLECWPGKKKISGLNYILGRGGEN